MSQFMSVDDMMSWLTSPLRDINTGVLVNVSRKLLTDTDTLFRLVPSGSLRASVICWLDLYPMSTV